MMSVEGPFLAAIIARLAEPKYNLAAFGVAFAFALIIEAPVIMIMSASTALVSDRESFLKMRNFTYFLNGLVTLLMLIILIPSIFYFITETLIGLEPAVSRLTHYALILLLPWPGAIGYRRFYQGILIRGNLTRRVAYGTVIRLISMAGTAIILYVFFGLDGALVGAIALSVAVTLEALASRFMAFKIVATIREKENVKATERSTLSYPNILHFYYPLALTSLLGLGVQPLVTFFMGHSYMALESLAVFPVVHSLVFIFRGVGLSFQEVGIALMGKQDENYQLLRNFAAVLGGGLVLLLSIIAFTPLSQVWYQQISGLSPELSQFAILPTQILAIMPGLTVLLSFQRAVLVIHKHNGPITVGTALEVIMIIALLFFTIRHFDMVGITAAALALIFGRLLANAYLMKPYLSVLRK
jgi:O-antigen/teichoic acid export membrane protein